MPNSNSTKRKIGVVIGGSGLIGGTLVHYFKTHKHETVDIRAPSSKKLSIRSESDIRQYIDEIGPDFIINCAITTLSSNSRLTLEVNYLGAVNLAKMAAQYNVPYIHITTAAALPYGDQLAEKSTLPIRADLSNYAKSKLLAEQSLKKMQKTLGLDYSSMRLAIAYGDHDHKIQGFHRMLFSIVDQSMPFLFTRKGVCHSYSNSRKVPYLVDHMLSERREFSGETYNFVDPEPVELAKLILTIKKYLQLNLPKEIYIPYNLARSGKTVLSVLLRASAKLGLIAQMPQELMFLESCYHNQTLSSQKLQHSSFTDPFPNETIFSNIPEIVEYYLTRWTEQNLIRGHGRKQHSVKSLDTLFRHEPEKLLERIGNELEKSRTSSEKV